ncbi:MAG: hypothetical protein PUF72_04110 [Clostridiales bacterium]|nr:hypothetical protein [Clostridiales bacterium]
MEYGNLAYKEYYAPKTAKKPQPKKNVQKANAKARKRAVGYIAAIAVLALSAGFMISTFVAVHETKDEVAALEETLGDLQAQTSQKAFDLEHAIDLDEVEKIASERLGMQRPEKYQTIYVNVRREDEVQKTAREVEGLSKRIASGLGGIWSNIVEFFSIQ